jgi:hypothetical protein
MLAAGRGVDVRPDLGRQAHGAAPAAYLREVLHRIADLPAHGLKSSGLWPWRHSSMADHDIASRMVQALQDTPSVQLYQMRALIDVLLDDPKREMAARMKLQLRRASR